MRRMTVIGGMLLAMISACTATPEHGNANFQFHPPLVYPSWKSYHAVTDDGRDVCIITTGHNGLKVTLGQQETGVSHTRRYSSGMRTRLRVNSHVYETPEAGFYTSQTNAIIHDLSVADKAYLEWSEVYIHGPTRTRTSTTIPLAAFKPMLGACRRSFSSSR